MAAAARFRINTPHVVHELFDDEIVLVNLTSGRYYCLRDTGVAIWSLLVNGRPITEIADVVSGHYGAGRDDVLKSTLTFVADLEQQGLLMPDDGASPGPPASLALPAARGPFSPPMLQIYTDMQDLLLLDPIHEVDELGWPIARKETTDRAE